MGGSERYEPLGPLEEGDGGGGTPSEDSGVRNLTVPTADRTAPPPVLRRVRVAAGLAAALLGTLLAASIAFPGSEQRADSAELFPADGGHAAGDGLVQLSESKHCHTAVPGEPCYKDVSWALNDGIYAHPEWYEGLTNKSNFETFQAVVYKINSTKCPLPCNYAPPDEHEAHKKKERHKSEVEGGQKHHAVERHQDVERHHDSGHSHEEHETPKEETDDKAESACHTAVEGDPCFKAVRWAMTDGLAKRPDWYEGLDELSSFEAFQAQLHKTSETNCPKPCACKTSVPGDKCHDHVLWVLKEGILKHPDWYEGLSQSSRFEEVQARLHEDTNTTCQKPCTPRFYGSPSIFAFSVFQSKGYEPGLMKAQLEKRQGIFSCDDFAVIADSKITLGPGPYGPVETLVIPHTTVGISKDNTAANTLIFIHAWQQIYNDFRFRHHDWTVKVDPDAVIVPDRMRTHLEPHTGKKVYIKNCNKYPGSPNWPMMFGSLEVISQSAIWTYMQNSDRCKNQLEWEAWGEDLYLAECLDLLGCESVHDYEIISDKVCLGVDCSDKRAAAFHAFKGTQEWFECWDTVFG